MTRDTAKGPISKVRRSRQPYRLGAAHASVTALSMICCRTLLHRGQENVRKSRLCKSWLLKSWPGMLGSIAVNLMGEPQAVHCGPWFCASSMGYFSEIGDQPGVPGSPASQPAALELKGSDAMTLISTWLHLGHSNSRCSKPIGPGEMRSSIILVWQCEQRKRSIAVKDCEDEGMMLPCIGREHYRSLSRR